MPRARLAVVGEQRGLRIHTPADLDPQLTDGVCTVYVCTTDGNLTEKSNQSFISSVNTSANKSLQQKVYMSKHVPEFQPARAFTATYLKLSRKHLAYF